jgi:hypothetical protein
VSNPLKYRVEYTVEAREHLRRLTARQAATVLDNEHSRALRLRCEEAMTRSRGDRSLTPAAMGKYESELEAIVTSGLPHTMPPVLYHYTTWAGFHGIVSSQVLHARSHDCTNDPAELTSVDAILSEIGTDLARRVPVRVREPLLCFNRDLPNRKISKVATIYLACFSLARDKASQWQRYGGEGAGVCLGFKVLHGEKHPSSKISSLPVTYDEQLLRSALRAKFEKVLACHKALGRTHSGGYRAGRAAAWSALMRIAAVASISSKKPEWSEEEEWRTVVMNPGTEFPRLRKPDGSEYIELRLRAHPLRMVFEEIVLGPRAGNPSSTTAAAAARRVLEDAGYGSGDLPPIRFSSQS